MHKIKQIKNKEGYFISDNGTVYSLHNTKLYKILETNKVNNYLTVLIEDKYYFVHRLVAETFIGVWDKLQKLDHIDGNRENNSVDNLEWCSGRTITGRQKISLKKLLNIETDLCFGTTSKEIMDTYDVTLATVKRIYSEMLEKTY